MWLSRSRMIIKGQQPTLKLTFEEAQREFAQERERENARPCVRDLTPQQAFQELYDGEATLDKHVEMLLRSLGDLNELVKGALADIEAIKRKLARVEGDLQRHEDESDDEKERGVHCARRAGPRRARSVVTAWPTDG